MKFGFKFSNLLGTVYKQGNIIFTPDGNSVISPVGNRVTVFDLVNHTSITLPIEARRNIKKIGLSPNGQILLIADESGRLYVINFQKHVLLGSHKFFQSPSSIVFSPNGGVIAVAVKNVVYLLKTPPIQKLQHNLERLSVFYHRSAVVSIDWSKNSLILLVACKNGHVLVRRGKDQTPDFILYRNKPVNCFFGNDEATIIHVVGVTGYVTWQYKTRDQLIQDGKWVHHFSQNVKGKVKSAIYHMKSQLLVIGTSNGQFVLYELPDNQEIYKLNISSHAISTTTINSSGEWLAFGCRDLGQLLVWEWRSETYILKQQGHSYNMNTLSYSPDGQFIATGGEDGKVKIWNTNSGYCVVTFDDHEAPVTAVKFSPVSSQNVVFTASMDGTVRAYDLIRYRNFRTFVTPNKTQFSCLAVDPSGEIICAGSTDTFEVFVWSVRNGHLTDVLSGHESPVYDVSFDPINPLLASASWDKTVKIWNIFEDREVRETIRHNSDVLACAYSPDGKKFVSSTLSGAIHIYETKNWNQIGLIEGKYDILAGRGHEDILKPINDPQGKCFTKIAFTPNGECIIAGGNTRTICIYHVEQQCLVKRFHTTNNLSYDGVMNQFDYKKITQHGHLDEMEKDYDSEDEDYHRTYLSLPGVYKGEFAKRSTKQKPRSTSIDASPTGRAWAVATIEGLLIYSLDDNLFFDPADLTININPKSILTTLESKQFLKALVVSKKLEPTTP
eukprot:gene933-1178_t